MAGNPDPSPATRFQPGNSVARGRLKGTRERLTTKFLHELAEDFDTKGKAAIVKVRKDDPGKYLAIVASLVPREVTLTKPMHGLDDAQVDEIVEKLRGVLMPSAEQQDEPAGAMH